MRLAAASPPARKPEPTIALINIVFLMLIFFLIAGTLAPPLDKDLTLVRTEGLEGREPPDALMIRSDGTVIWRGQEIDIADAARHAKTGSEDGGNVMRIVPDRDLPAIRLIEIAEELRRGGAARIFVVTERGLE
ncbi:ExbD/TolR family protein [Oricola indica]|uniref:ExbD/TolR family protein n=1 Tax=Oricola indica TaxID=2872591 RepID=UPI003CCBDE08